MKQQLYGVCLVQFRIPTLLANILNTSQWRLHLIKFVCQNDRIGILFWGAPGAPPGSSTDNWWLWMLLPLTFILSMYTRKQYNMLHLNTMLNPFHQLANSCSFTGKFLCTQKSSASCYNTVPYTAALPCTAASLWKLKWLFSRLTLYSCMWQE